MSLIQIGREKLDADTLVLSVKGDLDAFSVAEFRQATAQDTHISKLIIELGSTFIDSAGLHALVGAVRRVREEKGDAAVVCTNRVSEMLTIAGFDRVVMLSSSVEEARTALACSHVP
jgi:anti-anti-sigma factor